MYTFLRRQAVTLSTHLNEMQRERNSNQTLAGTIYNSEEALCALNCIYHIEASGVRCSNTSQQLAVLSYLHEAHDQHTFSASH
jgi:hypothetical protein